MRGVVGGERGEGGERGGVGGRMRGGFAERGGGMDGGVGEVGIHDRATNDDRIGCQRGAEHMKKQITKECYYCLGEPQEYDFRKDKCPWANTEKCKYKAPTEATYELV